MVGFLLFLQKRSKNYKIYIIKKRNQQNVIKNKLKDILLILYTISKSGGYYEN